MKLEKVKPIKFDWNKGNIDKNWRKHKVGFKECEEIFFNKPLKTLYDIKHSQNEKRYLGFGKTNKNRKLLVAFTIRNKKIRIISARDMSRKERKIYGKK
jgi:uncharacterized DUF497 family protein